MVQDATIMDKLEGKPLVMVRWADITGHDSPWIDPADALEMTPARMMTVGVLVNLTDDHLTIAGTWETGDEHQFGNVNCIPRGCVTRLAELRVPMDDPEDVTAETGED